MKTTIKKVAVIGPLYPYKGGIAQYNAMLIRTLRNIAQTIVIPISYEVQYPKLLFHAPQKDYNNSAFKIEDAIFSIHTANPLGWKKVAHQINSEKPDLVIFEWWHPYFIPCYSGIIKHLKNTKIMFICHNVLPHEKLPIVNRWIRHLLKKSDYFIVHSDQDAQELYSMVPNANYKKAKHPSYYSSFVPAGGMISKAEAQSILHIEKDRKVLLYFGFIRKYKGLKYLLHALPQIKKSYPEILLLVVGEFRNNKKEYLPLLENPEIKNNIQVYDEYITDSEVGKFFIACDLLVLPYESATQTGIAPIAFGFGKPVIATDVGGLPDVIHNGKKWLPGCTLQSRCSGKCCNTILSRKKSE